MATSEAAQPTARVPARPVWQKVAFCVSLTVVLTGTAGLLGEAAARTAGRTPWDPTHENMPQRVEPGGKLMKPDQNLGYVLCPGEYTVHVGNAHSFRVRNVDELRRATRPAGAAEPAGPGVWLFGDSFSYGWAVEDHETYAWKLQEAHPELSIQNFSIGGYSTLQSLLEFEVALERMPAPKLVTIAYSSFHDGRNAMLRANRKAWSASLEESPNFPLAWMEDGKLQYGVRSLRYEPWPLMTRSAFVNLIEENYNRTQVITSHAERVSQALIEEFHQVAADHGTEFVLLGIFANARTTQMLRWAESKGIRSLDISVDYSKPENITVSDAHPSAHAHSSFAQSIERLLPR
ncbi:MAG: SGNH/GDSL hydrolase family protein [Polyangiaceae bacterium]|nr:SGNH/GDSL hydrolase family protein [Polyangiaceae bacterium]